MQLLFDLFPVIAFFVAYKLYDIFVATVVIIIAALIQVGAHWLRTRSVNRMHLATAGLVLLFGGITLALHDQIYIQWKPTVLNWLFALAFLASHRFGAKPLVQRFMEPVIEQSGEGRVTLPGSVWRAANWAWIGFFTALGVLNLYVVYNFDENTWVNFKLFGVFGLMFAFSIAQAFWLLRKAQRWVDSENPPHS